MIRWITASLRNRSGLRGAASAAVLAAAFGPVGPLSAVDLIGVAESPELSSVLITTRKAEPSDAVTPEHTLEPISQISDYEPELADPLGSLPVAPDTPDEPSAVLQATPEPVTPQVTQTGTTPRVAQLKSAAQPRAASPTVVSDAPSDTDAVRQAKFNGVLPGTTTLAELIKAWGEPFRNTIAQGDLSGKVLSYAMKPFKLVEVLVSENVVRVVRVTLAEPSAIADLEAKLKLVAVDSVDVVDPETARLLGVSYPEKGLTLLTTKSSELAGPARIGSLVLEPLESKAFTLRAENRPWREMTARLADLDRAITLDATDAHAWWLKSVAHLDAGQAEEALQAANEATSLRAGSAAYRLALAQALVATGDIDKGVVTTREVLDDPSAATLVRAQALHTLGSLASLGGSSIANKSIGFHTKAIELADELSTSPDRLTRQTARRVLVEAHLAIANEIARREYKNRDALVADWIGRASGLAEAAIDAEDGDLELRLQVAREAVSALASMRPSKDPSPWVTEAEETAATLLTGSEDPLFKARIAWELGDTCYSAVRVEHIRGDASQALQYGAKAIEQLSAGAEPRITAPLAQRTVGELYFYLGAVNAVHRQNHAEAVGWYDKSQPLLEDVGDSELVTPRRTGEMLVSMGVSYWQEDRHELAISITERGAEVMQKAIDAGVLEERSLEVPYSNLAAMNKSLGKTAEATRYTKLAQSVRGTGAANVAAEPEAPQAVKPQATPVAKRPAAASATQRQAAQPSSTEVRRTPRQAGRGGAVWTTR
ncbi:tetratricopeptide repeat protein [Botrimarina hoheduenensis]|uniref:Tetratricopeptide repeat protein n=1 Tax=Botrimarina hoheduenensis TaxID=2528000 RepID=A0A5C5WA37_9BACT|nr:hypothetical protein [Botrimarina hoheduenensis]TWT47357.1 hypothetical protein Pla111_09700 [Botrimarina hoheduenensis]